jgi:hypothetical protein
MTDAAVVWVGEAPAQAPPLLAAWASTRGLRLMAPESSGRHTIAVDPAVATHVEEDLHAARELLAQHDADGAERALARAEGTLRLHPEVPQGAWLLAEVQRGWATRYARLEPIDATRAARAWNAAAALDGGRMAALGEPTVASEPQMAFTIEVTLGNGQLRLDGKVIAPGPQKAAEGTHQLIAVSEGAVVFASWITVAEGTLVRIALPTAAPCSSFDLARAPTEPSSVRCPSWILARADGANYEVRTCSGSSCGPELLVAPWSHIPNTTERPRHDMPKWLTWTLVGAATLAVGVGVGVAAWELAPVGTRTQFVQGSSPH